MRSVVVLSSLLAGGCFLAGYERVAPRDEQDGGMDAGGRDGAIDEPSEEDDLDAAPARDASSLRDADTGLARDAGDDGGLDATVELDGSTPIDAGEPCHDGGCALTPLSCDAGNCTGTCRPPSMFDGKLDCAFGCLGQRSCVTTCAPGSTCDTSCLGGGTCRAVCESGSRCELTCDDVERCQVSCASGAQCLLRCIHGGSCDYTQCTSGRLSCADGVVACGRACPP